MFDRWYLYNSVVIEMPMVLCLLSLFAREMTVWAWSMSKTAISFCLVFAPPILNANSYNFLHIMFSFYTLTVEHLL